MGTSSPTPREDRTYHGDLFPHWGTRISPPPGGPSPTLVRSRRHTHTTRGTTYGDYGSTTGTSTLRWYYLPSGSRDLGINIALEMGDAELAPRAGTPDESLQEWREHLKGWVWDNILTYLTSKPEVAALYIDNQRLPMFELAFTHETYDFTNNYERLETLGDAIISELAFRFFSQRYPDFTPSQLSEMKSYYTSDVIQSQLLSGTGADGLVRIASGIGVGKYDIIGDVFEALYAAVFNASESITPGIGNAACWNLFLRHYGNYNYDTDVAAGNYKTQVTQIFSRFARVGAPRVEIRDTYNQAEVTVSLGAEHYELLRNHRINIPRVDYIGKATGISIRETSDRAYKQAYELLKSYGITTAWSKAAKLADEFQHRKIAPYVPAVRQRYQEEGYERVTFETSRKMSADVNKVIMLIGIRADGTQVLLAVTEGSQDTLNTKMQLMRYYANREDLTTGSKWKTPEITPIHRLPSSGGPSKR